MTGVMSTFGELEQLAETVWLLEWLLTVGFSGELDGEQEES